MDPFGTADSLAAPLSRPGLALRAEGRQQHGGLEKSHLPQLPKEEACVEPHRTGRRWVFQDPPAGLEGSSLGWRLPSLPKEWLKRPAGCREALCPFRCLPEPSGGGCLLPTRATIGLSRSDLAAKAVWAPTFHAKNHLNGRCQGLDLALSAGQQRCALTERVGGVG